MPLSKESRTTRAKLAAAAAAANRNPDDPVAAEAVTELRRAYRFTAAADYISEILDAAPPLTGDQRRRLAALLDEGANA